MSSTTLNTPFGGMPEAIDVPDRPPHGASLVPPYGNRVSVCARTDPSFSQNFFVQKCTLDSLCQFPEFLEQAIAPSVKDLQNTNNQGNYQQAGQDYEQIDLAIMNLVNGLGNQLAKQLHGKFYPRIRSLITGAATPSTVGFVSSSPSTGSLMATLDTLAQTTLGSASLVNNVVAVYQDAMISGHTARQVAGDFASFGSSFEKTITPLAESATNSQVSQDQQLETAIITLVNGLGTQLSNDLGPQAQSTIRNLITGSTASSGVNYVSGTPVPGSLLATLMSVQTTDLQNWDFINDVVSVYASSSPTFT